MAATISVTMGWSKRPDAASSALLASVRCCFQCRDRKSPTGNLSLHHRIADPQRPDRCHASRHPVVNIQNKGWGILLLPLILNVNYWIEPIGPEHFPAEIIEQMELARAFGATILSVMRRIPVAGTPYAGLTRLTEIEIARIVAIARLFLGDQIRQMGVHEPSMVSLRAGAHRICAEVGMNPRDRAVDTAKGRGLSVTACEQMLWEAGFTHARKMSFSATIPVKG